MDMYLADYHLHSRWSRDASIPMESMAEAAAAAGMDEICFTDHVEALGSGSTEHNTFDFPALEEDYAHVLTSPAAQKVKIRLGVELAGVTRDLPYANVMRDSLPPVDFIIGSQHQLSERYGGEDLFFCAAREEKDAREQIRDYLDEMLKLAKWGRFSVLGHLTLPLRYMNERNGLHATFDGFEAEVEEIFRALVANGCGIEVNTNRGADPIPDAKWLRLYRACGGELVTLGSDAHTTQYVGCHIREGQALLRACGFTRFAAFERLQPIFHAL